MTRVRARGEDIRRFILNHVEKHPADIAKVASDQFKITRQAVNKHLQRLTSEKALSESGNTRSRTYKLCSLVEWRGEYEIQEGLTEDAIWRNDVAPVLGEMPDNVKDIWHYGFTEMFNNAIDHSGARKIFVRISKSAATAEMSIVDNGIGIFKKIQSALKLLDARHAVLELAKGKFTTDPSRHSGEGIFFSSRVFDEFRIKSGDVYFSHQFADELDWILESNYPLDGGTIVLMRLHNHTARTLRRVFDQYSADADFGFSKTVVPVQLAQYGDDKLISRSQAKRLLARVELFKVVILDFTGVASIGQAFADEVFRVFVQQHQKIELMPAHANSAVKRMIERAKSGAATIETPTVDDGQQKLF